MAQTMETTTAPERVWLNQKQAADYAGVDPVTIWRARKAGDLRAGGVGRKPRIHVSELDRWIQDGGPDQ